MAGCGAVRAGTEVWPWAGVGVVMSGVARVPLVVVTVVEVVA